MSTHKSLRDVAAKRGAVITEAAKAAQAATRPSRAIAIVAFAAAVLAVMIAFIFANATPTELGAADQLSAANEAGSNVLSDADLGQAGGRWSMDAVALASTRLGSHRPIKISDLLDFSERRKDARKVVAEVRTNDASADARDVDKTAADGRGLSSPRASRADPRTGMGPACGRPMRSVRFLP